MQAKEGYMQEKTEKTKKESGNVTYVNEETDPSKLKSSPRGSIIQSRFFNQMTRKTKHLKRSHRALEKWSLER